MFKTEKIPSPSWTEYNFIHTVTDSANELQGEIDSSEPNKNLILQIVWKALSAVADVLIDTGKTPIQSIEHAKTAIVQLFSARTSGQGHPFSNRAYNNSNPSKYSIKGALFYTECAVSHAIFTAPTILLGTIKLVHQLGAHFFYKDETYSIGVDKKGELAWHFLKKSDASDKCIEWQNNLYTWTRSFTKQTQTHQSDDISPRLLSPFIAFADVVLDTVSPLAQTIETVCRTVGHLFGALTWQKDCSLRGVIVRTDLAFFRASQTISAIVFMLPKFLQKTWAILYDPEHAYSIRAFSSDQNSERLVKNARQIQLIYV